MQRCPQHVIIEDAYITAIEHNWRESSIKYMYHVFTIVYLLVRAKDGLNTFKP